MLNRLTTQPLLVFEIGFGTGLNAFLTAIKTEETKLKVGYSTVENSPLTFDEAMKLNYTDKLQHKELFAQMHRCKWNEEIVLNDFFTLKKIQTELLNFSTNPPFNLIYYDAFAPAAQPELWTTEIFEKLFSMLQPGGLVTYCAKGSVRRAMKEAGFAVKKLPRPPGKREMLRAEKS